MKKRIFSILLVFCFVIPCMFMLSGCKDKKDEDLVSKFSLLQQGQTLNVGTSNKFTNNQYSTTQNYYLEYAKSATAVLEKVSSSYSNSFHYDGNYYRWNITKVTDNMLLGTKTVTTIRTYEYLTFGEDKNIVVRLTTQTDTSYDFSAKEYEKACDVSYNLGSYFSSIQDLKEKAPHLYDALTVRESNKYYIETPKTTYSYTEDTYKDTYFYFN